MSNTIPDEISRFTKENFFTLTKAWDRVTLYLNAKSLDLWPRAYNCYKNYGRGAFFITVPNLENALYGDGYMAEWGRPVNGTIEPVVDTYNPETQFVAYVRIIAREDVDLIREFCIEKDAAKGMNLRKIPEKEALNKTPGMLDAILESQMKFGCQLCDAKEGSVLCRVCKLTRYCSEECRDQDREAHHECCETFLRNKFETSRLYDFVFRELKNQHKANPKMTDKILEKYVEKAFNKMAL